MSRTRDNSAAREEKLAANIRVAELVKVVRFDPQTMTIDAQPLVKSNIDGTAAAQPQLTGVPVASIAMGDFTIRPWYKKGDMGVIIVCDKDIDQALKGEVAEAATSRNHDLGDSIFIGGICKEGKSPSSLPENALVLAAGSTYLAISQEAVTISGDLIVNGITLNTHTHTCPDGATSGPQ